MPLCFPRTNGNVIDSGNQALGDLFPISCQPRLHANLNQSHRVCSPRAPPPRFSDPRDNRLSATTPAALRKKHRLECPPRLQFLSYQNTIIFGFFQRGCYTLN